MHAPRILEALFLLSMVIAFVVLSRRHVGSSLVGIAAGVVALFYHVNLGFWHTAQPESFGGALIAWALVLASYRGSGEAPRTRLKRIGAWTGCAGLFALAAVLKPPLGGGIVFAFAVVAVREWQDGLTTEAPRRLGTAALSFVIGGASIIGLYVLYLISKGAWGDFLYIFFEYLPNYAVIEPDWVRSTGRPLQVFTEWPAAAHPFVWLGVLLALAPPRVHEREKEALFLVLGAAVAQVLGIAMQAKFFPYHYGGVIPLVALIGVWGYAKLWCFKRARWALLAVVILGIHYASTQDSVFVRSKLRWQALTSKADSDRINDELHTIYDVNAQANRVVAEWIGENTPAHLPIFVWGFEPTIYHRSGRRPASRFIYNVPQRSEWGRDAARSELIEDLNESQPSAIITLKRDRFPYVVGNDLDSEESLATFPQLSHLIDDRYKSVVVAEDLTVYMRKDLVPPAP
jgi:hypothetical protein